MFSVALLGLAALAAAAPAPEPQSIDFSGVIAAGAGSVQVGSSSSSTTSPISIIGYFPEPLTLTGQAAINAPLDCQGGNTYMGYKYFNDGLPFDPTRCAAACTSQSEYNTAHPPSNGPAQTCQFFNTYVLNKNGSPQGQYCVLYSEQWGNQYATNVGQYRGSDKYTITYSQAYVNASSNGVPKACASQAYSTGNYFQ